MKYSYESRYKQDLAKQKKQARKEWRESVAGMFIIVVVIVLVCVMLA